MSDQLISVSPRETTGKNASRRLRRDGRIPATLYGEGKDPVSVSVVEDVVERILHSKTGENTLLDLALEGTDRQRTAMIKAYQVDPVTDRLIHADFIRISSEQELELNVHVELEGVPDGVRLEGGRVEFSTREVLVACKPRDIPAALVVDISEMHIGQTLRASDIAMPDGVRLLTDGEQALATVHEKAIEEVAPTEEEEAAAAATGEEAPTEGDDDAKKEES